MQNIILKPIKATKKVFDLLEKKKLIKTFKPTENTVTTKKRNGCVDILYTSRKSFGAHRFMCIGKKNKKVQLCYHLDNEDLFFLNPQNTEYAKLYLVFALDKIDIFNKKLKKEVLKNKDFITVEVCFNDPNLSFFSVLKGTVHCEVVDKNDIRQHPVFFVSESSELKNNKIKHNNIEFLIYGENIKCS